MPLDEAPISTAGLGQVFRSRDFRLLWGGQFVSLLGDQFFLVALPWLVLQLTGDPLAIGSVLAVSAAPRAIFLLLGGVLIDRFSPRAVMMYSNIGRMVLVGVLAILTLTGAVELWMLYFFGFLLGLGYALFLPAQAVIVPRLVSEGRLQTGNAIMLGTTQLALFIGPVTAGILITLLGHQGTAAARVPQASGIALVFALDAVGFFLSAITLLLIASPLVRRDRGGHVVHRNVLHSLAAGVADVWRDKTLRLYFVLIGAVNLALLGPLSVGVPLLAHTRFRGGAFAYGAVLSGLGAGALVGVVAAGVLRRPPGRAFAAAMLGSTVLLGIGLSLLGALPSAGLAVIATFLIGLAEGYLIVEFITWLQIRTSREQLGRMMSILLLVSLGQAPVSNLIAGGLMHFSVSAVMIAAGGLIVLVAVTAAFSPSVWRISENCLRPAQAGEGQ